MKISNISQHLHKTAIIGGIGLIFSILRIGQATIQARAQQFTDTQYIQQAYEASQKQEYEKALAYITGDTSQDYYNRGALQTLLAYKNALQNTVPGMESAQTYITQAQNNFALAKKLGASSSIHDAIKINQRTLDEISPIIRIKTCYTIGQAIVDEIENMHKQTKNISELLEQEQSQIQKSSTRIGNDCSQKLNNIINNDKKNIKQFSQFLDTNKKIYTSDLSERVQEPIHCIQTPYDNILPTINETKTTISTYTLQHQNILTIVKNKDLQSIQELCEQTKNDAQINQEINNSIQNLLAALQENTTQQLQKNSSVSEYKHFFTEDEQKILQEIHTTNQGRINKVLDIKNDKNYTPQKYINDMFNQFYGNSGDFINLHK